MKESSFPDRGGDGGSVHEIRSRIADTRAEMDRTLDELGARFDPRNLLDQLVDFLRSEAPSRQEARRAIGTAGRRVAGSLREHPLPAMLIGAGLAWLVVQQVRSDDDAMDDFHEEGEQGASAMHRAGERMSGAAEAIGRRASHTMHRISGAARDVGHRARSAGGRAVHSARRGAERSVREGYDRARERVVETIESSPLAAAGGALACGLLAGLLFPATRAEDRVLGKAADRAKDRARSTGERILEKGSQAVQSATEEIRRESGSSGERDDDAQRSSSVYGSSSGASSGWSDKNRGTIEHRSGAERESERGRNPSSGGGSCPPL